MTTNYQVTITDDADGVKIRITDWGSRSIGDGKGADGIVHAAIQSDTEAKALDILREALERRQDARRNLHGEFARI